ncbi:hypothetical protein [Mycobacterium sp. PSTR-4-N]|uniref:hypothetical protein n=1 Tax=Mycobacterium sp. PSTR-4-N TaxID=2917745 RepID=UPI001F14D703|nr:hypothetical protein [Mycobacterium sp. PSTR-4-N]MCG7592434.1 hypothetical protein [Mycobacterium sp. PSTR-4-N]
MSAPQRFRKKPVEVEAMQWPRDDETDYQSVVRRAALHQWVWDNGGKTYVRGGTGGLHDVHVVIETLEGDMRVAPGDWVIRGIAGEFYPCKADIFAATYTAVDPKPETPRSAQLRVEAARLALKAAEDRLNAELTRAARGDDQ